MLRRFVRRQWYQLADLSVDSDPASPWKQRFAIIIYCKTFGGYTIAYKPYMDQKYSYCYLLCSSITIQIFLFTFCYLLTTFDNNND